MLVLPPENEFDDFGHVSRRILCFAGGDAETFGSANCRGMSGGGRVKMKGRACKAGGDKYSCKARETVDKGCAGDGPVMGTDEGMVCVYTDVDQYAEDDKEDDGDDLEKREPVF